MVTSFNYDIAPSIAERARKPSPFARMTESKARIEHTIGSVIANLRKFDRTLHKDTRHAAAVDVLAALRALRLVKADISEIERSLDQYTKALSEQVTKSEARK